VDIYEQRMYKIIVRDDDNIYNSNNEDFYNISKHLNIIL